MSTPAATTPVTGVDFVNVPTSDLDRARTFYGEVLGLEPSAVYQRGEAPPMGAEFETGTVTIALIDSAAVGREFRANTLPIALRVDDVEAARAELEARGVTFHADTLDTGVCHMAFFSDPDGNALMLHHRYAPRVTET
jgi:predicted enzyme related to lactoylglutathione lyase